MCLVETLFAKSSAPMWSDGAGIGLWPPPLRRARNKFLRASSLCRTLNRFTIFQGSSTC